MDSPRTSMAHPLRMTLSSASPAPHEVWSFHLPASGQRGRLIGTLASVVRALLYMARHHRGGIAITLPRAGWLGLLSHRVVIRGEQDLVRLRAIDVERLQVRHLRGQRGERLEVVTAAMGERMPLVWPAVP
jgi:hypothetical protein